MNERTIQNDVVAYARKHGAVAIKLSTAGRFGTTGWPDYLFLFDGAAMFIEFKRSNGKLTPLQASRIDQLNKAGFFASCVYDAEHGKAKLREFFRWRD